jgi:hypothetical protein
MKGRSLANHLYWLLSWVLPGIVGMIFLWAGISKLMDVSKFATDIYHYKLLPMGAARLLAVILPWWECALGIALGIPFSSWQRSSIFGAIGLLGIFSLALLAAGLRGLDISCGCFGTNNLHSIGQALWLDGLMLGGLIVSLRFNISRSHS